MVSRYIEQVSTYAADVDGVINLIGILVGFWFVVTQGVFFYFIWAYRKGAHPKAEYISGTEPELKRWIVVDPTGAQTAVTLSEIAQGVALEASLFELPRQASFENRD